jgi:tetratricopeptide (TPR) repeat protein
MLMTAIQGSGEFAFDRILGETSAYYLLGVEPDDSDRDGRPRQLTVRVNAGQRGVSARARSWVMVPRPGADSHLVASAAGGPRYLTNLPTAEDVAAWERFWSGPGTMTPSTPRPAPPPPATATVATEPARPALTPIDDLFVTYASGHTTVVQERLRTVEDLDRYRPYILPTLARWRYDWSPARAAFALEFTLTALAGRWPDPQRFLTAARAIVVARPDPPGTRPADDAFELLFHRTAIGLLAALQAWRDVEAYFEAIRQRVATDGEPAAARLVDGRLVLARAMAIESQTLPVLLAGVSRDTTRSWIVPTGNNEARRRLQRALALLDAAAAHPETREEAQVRRAFVLHRLGAHAEALAALDAIGPPSDRAVAFWRLLIRGRVLVASNRPGDAVAAYEQAAALIPGAQTPAVALAALLTKLGDHEGSVRWAAVARSTPEDHVDPWPLYWRGPSRFLPAWLNELRSARP